jgi:cyclic pyranopterin phosphate synthase
MKDINEHEIISLYEYAKQRGIQIRFIEYMENENATSYLKTLPSKDVLEQISKKHLIDEIETKENSAAKLYKDESGFVFGIIEPYDDSFCKSCNRIRLSAEGDLIPCLYYEDSLNIKSAIKSDEKLTEVLETVVKNKPEKNKWSHNANNDIDTSSEVSSRAFYFTGG